MLGNKRANRDKVLDDTLTDKSQLAIVGGCLGRSVWSQATRSYPDPQHLASHLRGDHTSCHLGLQVNQSLSDLGPFQKFPLECSSPTPYMVVTEEMSEETDGEVTKERKELTALEGSSASENMS